MGKIIFWEREPSKIGIPMRISTPGTLPIPSLSLWTSWPWILGCFIFHHLKEKAETIWRILQGCIFYIYRSYLHNKVFWHNQVLRWQNLLLMWAWKQILPMQNLIMLYISCLFSGAFEANKMFKNRFLKLNIDFQIGLNYRIGRQKWDLHNQNLWKCVICRIPEIL